MEVHGLKRFRVSWSYCWEIRRVALDLFVPLRLLVELRFTVVLVGNEGLV